MKRDPEVGETANVEMIVHDEDTAAALGPVSGDSYPAVLATTRAIALCELAAGKILHTRGYTRSWFRDVLQGGPPHE